MNMEDIFVAFVAGTMLMLPFALVALDFIFYIQKKEKPIFELIAFFIGSVYMALAYLLWDLPDYRQPLNLYNYVRAHEPFSSEQL